LSTKEWELAINMGDKYHIYRVYNACTNQARLCCITNPSKLWQEGKLIANPIRILL
jgi:hypothetical protein